MPSMPIPLYIFKFAFRNTTDYSSPTLQPHSSMFTFKQFTIDDTHCAMKVGTDGVLLGAWADVAHSRSILDIGSGSGLIALMLAQRAPHARVTGIEIDNCAANDACHNVAASPFSERTEIVHADLLEWCKNHAGEFDTIVSNPPFHEESLLPPSAGRATARHTDGGGLNFAALLHSTHILLRPQSEVPEASFSVVLPAQAAERFTSLAAAYGLQLHRRTDVVTRPQKPCKRVLLSFKRLSNTPEHDTLVLMKEDGSRSTTYSSLCADFYIK